MMAFQKLFLLLVLGLFAESKGPVKDITSQEEFDRIITFSKLTGLPVIVDYYSDSCGPCRVIAPRYLEIAKEYQDRAVFLKVNVATAGSVAQGIRSMPTFRFYVDGKKKQEFSGADEGQLRRLTKELSTQARKNPKPVQEIKTKLVFKTLLRDANALPVVVAFVEKENEDCKTFYPAFKELSKTFATKAAFAKVYPSENLPTAELVGVTKENVPVAHIYVSGKKVEEVFGNKIEDLKAKIQAAVDARVEKRKSKSSSNKETKTEQKCTEVKPEPEPQRLQERSPLRLALAPLRPEKVVIIGAGPAGLTAAIYAARAGLQPLVIAPNLGGQLMFTKEVENYPTLLDGTGPKLLDLMRIQAETFQTEFEATEVLSVDLRHHPFTIVTNRSSQEVIKTQTLIIATGADARWLDAPGEARLRAKGISSCAVCDGYLSKDKDVIVIGGGDTAMEEALFLSRICKSVTIIHRRDSFRASYIMQERVLNHEKISVVWNSKVSEFKGEEFLTHTGIENLVTGETRDIEAEAAFIAIGHTPNTQLFAGVLEMDTHGYLLTKGRSTATTVEGVFAAGDVADNIYRQAITSAGSGAMAALDLERWLNEHGTIEDKSTLAEADFSTWTMKMIKAVMKETGISMKGCVEKADYIARLKGSSSTGSSEE